MKYENNYEGLYKKLVWSINDDKESMEYDKNYCSLETINDIITFINKNNKADSKERCMALINYVEELKQEYEKKIEYVSNLLEDTKYFSKSIISEEDHSLD